MKRKFFSSIPSFAFLFFGLYLLAFLTGCSKIEFKTVDKPAYLRVFNNLRFKKTIVNKEEGESVLTMLINPQFDAQGIPVSAETVGDFLVTRDRYAPPYPSHIGTGTDVYNPEYPGKEKVIAGPILNGFDLSSWAQTPSGQKRIAFYFRPKNEVPFFHLETRFRSKVMIDTTLSLQAGEVYTLHVLQKDFENKKNGILLRTENFHKLSLSDSLVYVNFYNMSAKGFVAATTAFKPDPVNPVSDRYPEGINDEMKLYYSLYTPGEERPQLVNGYTKVYLTTLTRNTSNPAVASYYKLPLFAGSSRGPIQSSLFQSFYFLSPEYEIRDFENLAPVGGRLARLTCYTGQQQGYPPGMNNSEAGTLLPNLIVNIHSGSYNPRSFATVNTIEIVNGDAYLTTIQRVFAPPLY